MYEAGTGTSLQAMFLLVNKIGVPDKNEDGERGWVKVGGVDLEGIGSKCKDLGYV